MYNNSGNRGKLCGNSMNIHMLNVYNEGDIALVHVYCMERFPCSQCYTKTNVSFQNYCVIWRVFLVKIFCNTSPIAAVGTVKMGMFCL